MILVYVAPYIADPPRDGQAERHIAAIYLGCLHVTWENKRRRETHYIMHMSYFYHCINIKLLGKTVSNQLRNVTTYLILLFTTKSKDTVHACMDGLGCFLSPVL